MRPHENITEVKLFSAWIEHDIDALERQKRYFDAVQSLPKVKLIAGVFQPRTVHCRADCRSQYVIQEEKKTDVNLAVNILEDAILARCDSMFIVSGDSDLQPAVEWVAKNKPQIGITVYVPVLPNERDHRRVDYYRTKGLNVSCQFLPIGSLKDNQLPHNVKLANGTFACRPQSWEPRLVLG